MNRSKILKYGIWALAPLIGAAVMLAFLYFRDRGSETFEPPVVVGEQALPGTPVAAEKIQTAQDFKKYPLYWLGDSFQSLNLAYLDKYTPMAGYSNIDAFSFTYGTCAPPPGGEGCAPPLEIQVTPLCWNLPERFGIERGDLIDFRGAKALWDEYGVRIWTGDSAILIGGHPHERIQQATEALAPLGNVEVALIDSKLPPPNFDSCPEIPIYPTSPPLPTPRTPYPY